ncbi:hypothetical protein CHELA20_52519 [Hyphomicrobiales bacterium]|nr:hypothetical protein CHELA41_22407 [Hyphomicrobiales bacterium]CAH1682115.1 hypothetical protein CHELA20_52519 [Hyphomicrobiales bacterium]
MTTPGGMRTGIWPGKAPALGNTVGVYIFTRSGRLKPHGWLAPVAGQVPWLSWRRHGAGARPKRALPPPFMA